ncbi:aminoglycoside phosphotransferase family protein [Chitinimonas lacunae]|uniref:Aminoglycoside phosphotransferase family protein n=1 Tax=Chitinimonas lacunae TaxID=1963018 RepID=A0ABV8MPT7_9NEIS
MDRYATMQAWLSETLGGARHTLSDPIGDASQRRYFRLRLDDGSTRIVMDAPPEHTDCRPFIQVAALLAPAVRVPQILARNLEAGFLLLSDLGDTDYQTALAAADETEAARLYRAALDSLVALQTAAGAEQLPRYDATALGVDLDRFPEWFIGRHLGQTLAEADLAAWQRCRAVLLSRLAAQPPVLVHFDYHSRNLLTGEQPGVIDFQDARYGPAIYDLASLLKDVYTVRPEEFRLDLAIRYWEAARRAGVALSDDFGEFYRDFEWTGVYRHLRTLGTFARLAHRDGKTRYLDDMPVALDYLRETCARYVELHPLYKLINRLTGFSPAVGYTF